uniref:Uncharacterized protein n=1 Tax=Alexandrium andersonii TaxID=327968 RepID=A0A7S2HBN5_9DINO
MKNKPDLHTISQDYAVAVMGALEREAVSELSDIHSQVDHYSLLPAMRLETRIEFSMAASLVLEHHQWAGRLFEQDGFQELGKEIENGECDLVVGVDNAVHRLVTITALHLERADGHILTQLGKYTKGQTITSCSFPGTKQQPKEHPKDAVERLLKAKLRPYADEISVMYRELVDEQERVSHKYGVSSRYMRTLFAAVLEDVDFPNTTVTIPFDGGFSSLSRLSSRSSRSSREVRLTQGYEAFAFVHELESSSETKFIYAWMSPEDHALITGPDAGDLAQTWVNRLLVDVLTQPFVPNEQDGSFTAI